VSRSLGLAWVLLGVWCAWLLALQGRLASGAAPGALLGRWTPDLGIVMLLALGPTHRGARMGLAVAIVSGARIAFTSDPALAVLVGYVAVAGVASRLRETLEIDRAVPRALLAALLALVLSAYWMAAARIALGVGAAQVLAAPRWAGESALATGAAALVLAPLLVRLPGLSPFRRRPLRVQG
jgi:hypothetical protein